MDQKRKNNSAMIESVVVFIVSAPLLLMSLVIAIIFLFMIFSNLGFVPDSYEILCYIATAMFIPTMVFDILAIVRLTKSLGLFRYDAIKSYQNRVKAFIDLYIIIGCLFLSNISFRLAEEDAPFVPFFLFLTVIPLVLVTWRFRKNVEILQALILEDIRQKRSISQNKE